MTEFYIIQADNLKELDYATKLCVDSRAVGPVLWSEGIHLQVMRRLRKPASTQGELKFFEQKQA